jgi:hypothetical protein
MSWFSLFDICHLRHKRWHGLIHVFNRIVAKNVHNSDCRLAATCQAFVKYLVTSALA